MVISTDPGLIQMDVVYPWLRGSYWSRNIRRDVVEKAYANSLVVGAYEDGVQIGVARVVTDRATFAWLADVFVAESARGRGIATQLVRALFDHPETQTLRRWILGTRDAHDVYKPFGFTAADPAIFMVHAPDPRNWSEPTAPRVP